MATKQEFSKGTIDFLGSKEEIPIERGDNNMTVTDRSGRISNIGNIEIYRIAHFKKKNITRIYWKMKLGTHQDSH